MASKAAKLEQLTNQIRTGGKGSMRRKVKKVHKSAGADDKRLQQTLQKLPQWNQISGIEEVNLFNEDGTIVHFSNPKVMASLEASTFSISGHAENKKLPDLMPGILNQLGIENIMQMRKLVESGIGAQQQQQQQTATTAPSDIPAQAVSDAAKPKEEEKKPEEKKPEEKKPEEKKPEEKKPEEKKEEEKKPETH